jgi:hypothetical protein
MASPRWGRAIPVAILLVLLGVMVTAVTTDLQAHARDRHEHADLDAAQRKLSASRFALAATSYDKALTTNHRSAIQASVVATLARLATAENALSDNDADVLFQGASIGTLENCLGGVQSSYQQIAAGNNTLAAEDISASSAACLSLAGGTSGGLVYPFDFPDPDVLLVGGTYFAYGTNSVAGNIQIIESTNLTDWNVVGNALPNLPSWAAPDATWAPAVAQIGGVYVLYYAADVAGPGGGEECISVATAAQPQGPFIDKSSSPLECQPSLGGSLDPSPFIDTDGVLGVEVQRRDWTSHDLVRAARPEWHRVCRQCHPSAIARTQSSVGGGSSRSSRPRDKRRALFTVLFGQQLGQRRLCGRGCHMHRALGSVHQTLVPTHPAQQLEHGRSGR